MSSKFLSRQFSRAKRWLRRNKITTAAVATLLLISGLLYAGSMERRLSVNPDSYRPLLELIADAESNGNYNAYYGNARGSDIQFTNMTIAEVLTWQEQFIADGSPSSAVGRYQFLNTTLRGLVSERNLGTDTLFDAATQDMLATWLLERRGSEAYVNAELTREEFAANLAKEWAALPRITGNDPNKSYYDGDGLNSSRVAVRDILAAIDPIEAAS